jgi:hypothetical protein
MKRWLAGILGAIALLAMTACGSSTGNQDACRAEARAVFPAVISHSMTQAEGQKRIDVACKGIDAEKRKAILDAERSAAMARSIP